MYWVYGQNCFWWATSMLRDSGIEIPEEAWKGISSMNAGVGTVRRFTDNKTAKGLWSVRSRALQDIFRRRSWLERMSAQKLGTRGLMMRPEERTDMVPPIEQWK
jgi:hypothetical protein